MEIYHLNGTSIQLRYDRYDRPGITVREIILIHVTHITCKILGSGLVEWR